MDIILCGLCESALVHLSDAVSQPSRNTTAHRYYVELNRRVDPSITGAIGSFMAIAETTAVPYQLDWSFPKELDGFADSHFGITRLSREDFDNARYDAVEALVDTLVDESILSATSRDYITHLDLRLYDVEAVGRMKADPTFPTEMLKGYLRRLLHQIDGARQTDGASSGGRRLLVAMEPDLQVIKEIALFLRDRGSPPSFPFPDLTDRILDPENFPNGVLTFAPADVTSIATVREDPMVRAYAARIREELAKGLPSETNETFVDAMIESYNRQEAGRKIKTIYEFGSWVVKPLHYVPFVSEVVTIVEDIKDIGVKVVERKIEDHQWFLIGVRMQQVSLEDYMRRVQNRVPRARTIFDAPSA